MTNNQLIASALEGPLFNHCEWVNSPLKNRPDRFTTRYYGYLVEVEYRPASDRWYFAFCWGTKPELVELLVADFPQYKANLNVVCANLDEVLSKVEEALDAIDLVAANVGLPQTAVQVAKSGVAFEGTNFAGYGERDFMAAVVQIQKSGYATVIPGVGSNLGFEFQVPSTGSRIDAVEFDAAGSVDTVIECQSGIQRGEYLDDEHFAKAISRYPQSEEVAATVKKIVIIAGGYHAHQLATFAQLPYEIVALVTSVVDGKVVLAPAA